MATLHSYDTLRTLDDDNTLCKKCNFNKDEVDGFCIDCAPRDTIPTNPGINLIINPSQVEELALITIDMEHKFGVDENFTSTLFNAALYDEHVFNELKLFNETPDESVKNDILLRLKRSISCVHSLELLKNDDPLYINNECDLCGSTLILSDVYYNNVKHPGLISFDEWTCPHCLSGTIYDKPFEDYGLD